ncbi:MAG: hypothetical protein J6T57_04380 [Alphaproteobacteria bacterium]|nr:hypothetical protein [Alphaproteobacteria bacterium]
MSYKDTVAVRFLQLLEKYSSHNEVRLISDLNISPEEFDIIKQEIQQEFGLTLPDDISGMKISDIYNQICEFHNQKSDKKSTSKPKKWNRRGVFCYIMRKLGENMQEITGNNEHRIQSQDHISDLRNEVDPNKREYFDELLTKKLGDSFGIIFDVNLYSAATVYNIANYVLYTLVSQGRAIDPREECAGMDPFWEPLWISLSLGCLAAILTNRFEVWAPTDKNGNKNTQNLEQQLSHIKSYAELEEFVVAERIKVQIDKIMFRNITVAGDFKNRLDMSDFLISQTKARDIQNGIEEYFNIVVDYDISGTQLNKLYTYVYNNVKDSKSMRDKLFEGVQIEDPQPIKVKNPTPQPGKKLLSRDELFAMVISEINSGLNRNTSVQTREKLYNLLMFAKDPDKLKNTFDGIEKYYGIRINLDNPKITVYNVCSAAYKSFVERGLAEDLRIKISDMNPLWGAVNKAIPYFRHLRSILDNERDVRVSVYNLSNCRTYDEYKQLVIRTKLLEEIRPIIANHIRIMPQKITLSTQLPHNPKAISDIYNECERIFNISIPESNRVSDTVENMVRVIIQYGQHSDHIKKVLSGYFGPSFEQPSPIDATNIVHALQTNQGNCR